MKSFLTVLLTVITAVSLVSCAAEPGTTTMRLVLKASSEEGAKSLLPENASLDVTKYSVSGTGPGGKTFNVNSDSSSITIDGLVLGTWAISAVGMNPSNVELVRGELEFELTSRPAPQTLVLDTLVGTGTLNVAVTWPTEDVPDPSVQMFLRGPGMSVEETTISPTVTTGRASFSQSLASGSYTLRMILKSEGETVAGLVEAVRISNGSTTEGTISLDFSAYPNSLGTLYLSNSSGSPVTGRISGVSEEVTAKVPFQVKFTPDTDFVEIEGLKIQWYLDGVSVKEAVNLTAAGDTITIDPEAGSHRLDAVVYNNLHGSTGSASCMFTAILGGNPGELAEVGDITDSAAGVRIAQDTIVSALPGGKFLIATPSRSSLQVCSVYRNNLKVERSYGASTFGWLGSVKQAFTDPDMNFVVMSDSHGGTENLSILSFNPDTNSITQTEGFRFEGAIDDLAINLGNVSAAHFADEIGYIYVADSQADYVAIFNVTGTTVSITGRGDVKLDPSYKKIAGLAVSPNASKIAKVAANLTDMVVAPLNSSNGLFTNWQVHTVSVEAPKAVDFLSDTTLVIGGESELARITLAGSSWSKVQAISTAVNEMEVSQDKSTIYTLSQGTKRVTTYTVDNTAALSQLGRIDLDYVPLRMSLNGENMIIVTQNGHLIICRVVR